MKCRRAEAEQLANQLLALLKNGWADDDECELCGRESGRGAGLHEYQYKGRSVIVCQHCGRGLLLRLRRAGHWDEYGLYRGGLESLPQLVVAEWLAAGLSRRAPEQ